MTRSTRRNAPLGAVDAEARYRRARFTGLPCQPIATSGGMMTATNTSSSATGYTSRQCYKAAVAATDLQLVYPMGWWINQGSGETALTGDTVVKAAIEYPSGTIIPVTFRGRRLATVDPSGNLISDPIAIDVAAGDLIYIRTWVDSPTGEPYPSGFPSQGPGFSPSGTVGWGTGDNVDSGTMANSDNINAFWNPIVCGQPLGAPGPVLAFVGDSISYGTGDGNFRPWWKYGVNNSLPCIAYARSGARAVQMVSGSRGGFPLLSGASHAHVLLGINDLTNGRSLAQLKADLTTIYGKLRGRGAKVFGCTIPPYTTSTDSWATTANQTPAAGFGPTGNRADLNAWIRAGADGAIDGYLELADTVETGRDTGIWKNTAANGAVYTTDGIHPNATGHQAMGAALVPSAYSI